MSRALALLLPVLLLTGCAPPSAEAVYLSMVKDSNLQFKEVPDDDDMKQMGRDFCAYMETAGFEDGMAYFTVNLQSWGLTADKAGDIGRAAIAAYCPAYSDYFE